MFDPPVTAFSAWFGGFDEGGLQDVRIAGERIRLGPDRVYPYSAYVGVTSTTPFSVIEIRNDDEIAERYAIDSIRYALVPEPHSGLLLFTYAMTEFLGGRTLRRR